VSSHLLRITSSRWLVIDAKTKAIVASYGQSAQDYYAALAHCAALCGASNQDQVQS
jgi:hypothetical protein